MLFLLFPSSILTLVAVHNVKPNRVVVFILALGFDVEIMAVVFMCSNVLQGNGEEKMGGMFIGFWTLAMEGP